MSFKKVGKSFKTAGITLVRDESEDKMFIGHNPLFKDDQVMVEQPEQPADEQDKQMKDAEIDDNNNNYEEEEKETVELEFTEQKANPENAINFRWPDIRGEDEEDIVKANLIENLQKQADEEIFPIK